MSGIDLTVIMLTIPLNSENFITCQFSGQPGPWHFGRLIKSRKFFLFINVRGNPGCP